MANRLVEKFRVQVWDADTKEEWRSVEGSPEVAAQLRDMLKTLLAQLEDEK